MNEMKFHYVEKGNEYEFTCLDVPENSELMFISDKLVPTGPGENIITRKIYESEIEGYAYLKVKK